METCGIIRTWDGEAKGGGGGGGMESLRGKAMVKKYSRGTDGMGGKGHETLYTVHRKPRRKILDNMMCERKG